MKNLTLDIIATVFTVVNGAIVVSFYHWSYCCFCRNRCCHHGCCQCCHIHQHPYHHRIHPFISSSPQTPSYHAYPYHSQRTHSLTLNLHPRCPQVLSGCWHLRVYVSQCCLTSSWRVAKRYSICTKRLTLCSNYLLYICMCIYIHASSNLSSHLCNYIFRLSITNDFQKM